MHAHASTGMFDLNATKITIRAMRRRRQGQLSSPVFGAKKQKCLTAHTTENWRNSIALYETVKLFDIGWIVIEKSRPEHDPKWTRLCDLLPTESSWRRHLQSKCKDHRGYAALAFKVAIFNCFSYFPKNHSVTVKSVTAAVVWMRFAADWMEQMTSFPARV